LIYQSINQSLFAQLQLVHETVTKQTVQRHKHGRQRISDIEGDPTLSLFPSPPSPRDCVAVIPGVQRFHGPCRPNIGGVQSPDPCDPCSVDTYGHKV